MTTHGSFDVAVVGGGIFGLCAAYSCIRRGLSVAVFDASSIGSGASGGIVGAMAPHTPDQWDPTKEFQLHALMDAEGYWGDVQRLSDLPTGYGRIGRLLPIMDERGLELAHIRSRDALDLWQGKYHWTVVDQAPAFIAPEAAPLGVIYETLAARIHPQKACHALHRALINLGVEIFENCAVEGFTDGAVSGNWGHASAKTIILASGLHGIETIGQILGTDAGAGEKGQAALLDYALPNTPQIFANGVYVVPHSDGTCAVGSTSERQWDTPDGTDAQLDKVIAKAQSIVPALHGAPIKTRWAAVRPKAKRRDPLLGPVPNHPNVFAALSGFKIGFGLAHTIGDFMANYAEQKTVTLPRTFTFDHHFK